MKCFLMPLLQKAMVRRVKEKVKQPLCRHMKQSVREGTSVVPNALDATSVVMEGAMGETDEGIIADVQANVVDARAGGSEDKSFQSV